MKKAYIVLLSFAILLLSCDKKDNPLSGRGSNGGTLGSASRDLLSSATYKKLIIEIHYMTGMRPTDNTVTNLKNFLNSVVDKPAGVEVIINEVPATGKSNYSLNDITALESKYRSAFNDGDDIAVHFLFVDGAYTDENVLGIAYRSTSMVVFESVVIANSGGLLRPSKEKLETTVVDHEFGHILGLVNLGSAMQTSHADVNNKNHCNNEDCLMYFQVNTTANVGNLMNSNPVLDANCKADLKANGGK